MNNEERRILQTLDAFLKRESVVEKIDLIVERVEQEIARDPKALLAWEPIPLAVYGDGLPDGIRSSWVFILRAHATTGAERHPNSIQRVMSYRRAGGLEIWDDDAWHSHFLVSDPDANLERRWATVPINVWHQAVVPGDNWVVVSFHTVPEDELIEERPDPSDASLTRQRTYLNST